MGMDVRLIRYYKKKLYGGRSIIARSIDFIILRSLVMFLIFLAFLYFSRSLKAAILISIFLTLAISLILALIKRNRIIRFIEKDTLRIKQKCLLETLTMMNAEDFVSYMSRLFEDLTDYKITDDGFIAMSKGMALYAFHNHPSALCSIDSVLKAARYSNPKVSIIISLSEFEKSARTFCTGNDIKLITGEQVLQQAAKKNMLPDEEAAQERAKNEMRNAIITLDALKKAAFSRTKVKAYIFCGIVVMCWPFVMGFRIYYPIISIICFVMAALTFRKNKYHEESHDVGIS
jgi:hypothetical protein